MGFIMRTFLPRYVQPFKIVNPSDPRARGFVRNFMPQANLDDPEVQDEIRQIKITSSMFAQLRKISKSVYKNAKSIKVPLLIIQGKQDRVVVPELTKRLLYRFPNQKLQYLEVDVNGII